MENYIASNEGTTIQNLEPTQGITKTTTAFLLEFLNISDSHSETFPAASSLKHQLFIMSH